MKFGVYSSIANPPRGEQLDRCIDEVIAEAQLAEASGFDSCFFGEHHQDHDGFLPSPLIVATGLLRLLAAPPGLYMLDSNRGANFADILQALSDQYHFNWQISRNEDYVYDQRLIDPRPGLPDLAARLPALRG